MSALRRQLNRWLLQYRYRLERTHHPQLFTILFASYLERQGGKASFLQVGANDGIRFDPLHEFITASRYHLRGVVIEPVPRFYEELKRTYAKLPDIKPVNAAIHNSRSTATLYVVRESCESHLPEWVRGIASFDHRHLIRPELPAECIEQTTVRCFPLAEVAEANDLSDPDLVQIDTEGYDGEIIRNIDFTQFRPAIIHFEHGLPDQVMSKVEFEELRQLLNRNGYQVVRERYDAIALRDDLGF